MQPTLKPITRRSRKPTRVEQRPVLQLPVPRPEAYEEPEEKDPAESQTRGVAIVDFYV